MEFKIKIDLTNEEIEDLKSIDWNSDYPNHNGKDLYSLCDKGIVMAHEDSMQTESWSDLTEFGKQVLVYLNDFDFLKEQSEKMRGQS